MLWPQIEPSNFAFGGQNSIRTKYNTFYIDALTTNMSHWSEAEIDLRFYLGDQSAFNSIYGNVPLIRRRNYSFNITRPICDLASGYQRNHRKSLIYTPVFDRDTPTTDQLTKILFSLNQTENYLDTVSKAFHQGACITGMNLLYVWLDYTNDPISGDIRVENLAYNEFVIDPFFRDVSGLSDCRGISKRRYISMEEAQVLYPDLGDELRGFATPGNRDGRYQFQPENYAWTNRGLMAYDEYYYRTYRSALMLFDTVTGECQEWTGKDDDYLRHWLGQNRQVTLSRQDLPTVHMATFIQNRLMYCGPQPTGIDMFPFIPVVGYFNPQTSDFPWKIFGMVRGMRDAQFLFNRRKVIELDILESQITSGWIFKENTLVNPADVWNMTGQGKGIALKQDAQIGDIQKIPGATIDPSMFALSESLMQLFYRISGANEEMAGAAVDEKAGVLSMLRQSAGATVLQILFDQLDNSLKQLGKVFLQMIQNNYTPGKVRLITGERPTEPFYTKMFSRYQCAVEEGTNTTTQRQQAFAVALKLREFIPISSATLLRLSTLPDKEQIMQEVQQSEQQQQQMTQRQSELQLLELQANIKLAEARAMADRGLGIERASRVPENQALAQERKANALKDEDEGVLAIVKAAAEIKKMDIEHVRDSIDIIRSLQEDEHNRVERSTQQTQASA